MTESPSHVRRGAHLAPHWLILIAVFVLVPFHYLNRADTVGVLTDRGEWTVLTGTAVSAWQHYVGALFLLGIVPVVFARWTGCTHSSQLGLGLGRIREGIRWLAVGVPLALIAGRIAASSPAMQSVYPLSSNVAADPRSFAPYAFIEFLYYGSWEVLFRGVLLFGLAPTTGRTSANLLQTSLSVVAHFGRPLHEAIAAAPAGLLFGWIDLRIGSIWYVALIHWLTGVSMDWWILARAGG
jgi:membrane protease YdiL (CAAX protease family)